MRYAWEDIERDTETALSAALKARADRKAAHELRG
jgi:hypothetical protein